MNYGNRFSSNDLLRLFVAQHFPDTTSANVADSTPKIVAWLAPREQSLQIGHGSDQVTPEPLPDNVEQLFQCHHSCCTRFGRSDHALEFSHHG